MNTREYARLQQRPLPPLRKLIRRVLHLIGVPLSEKQTEDAALLLWRPIIAARTQNHLSAVRYIREAQIPVAIPAPRAYPYTAVVSTIEKVVQDIRIDGSEIDVDTRTNARVIEVVRPAIEGPLIKHALEPARETVALIGEQHEHYGWARVLVGATSCAWCAMLASRGAVYTSKAAALGRGGSGLGAYHMPHIYRGRMIGGLCDCIALPVIEGRAWEGEAAHKRLDALWQDNPSLDQFTSVWNRAVREEQTEQYLAPSVQKQAA